jgi:hypothetical protein
LIEGGVSIRNYEQSISIDANDPRAANQAFDILMLMPMQHNLRLGSLDVLIKRGKSQMHIVFAIVHQSRRIVGNEYVDRRKAGEQSLHLKIFE